MAMPNIPLPSINLQIVNNDDNFTLSIKSGYNMGVVTLDPKK